MEPSSVHTRNGYDFMLRRLMIAMGFSAVLFAILLSATYRSSLHPPSLLAPDGSIRFYANKWQTISVYFNGFSFFSSLCGMLVAAGCGLSHFLLPIPQGLSSIDMEVAVLLKRLALALPRMVYVCLFFILSMSCSVLAYVSAGLATVGETRSEQLPVILPCAVGSIVFVQSIFVSGRDVFELWRCISKSHAELWFSVKRETLFGAGFAKYVEYLYGSDSTNSPSPQD